MSILRLIQRFTQGVKGICGSFTANGMDNYLDTGIVPNRDSELIGISQFAGNGSSERIGLIDSGNAARLYYGRSNLSWICGYGNKTFTVGTSDDSAHLFKVNKDGFYVDGVMLADFSSAAFGTTTLTVWLLARLSTTADVYSTAKAYKHKIIHNGQTHAWDFNPNGDESVVYTIDGVLQTPPTIQGTVTPDQWGTDCYTE